MASENKSKVSILTNGIIKENPVLRLVLGTCSCLAVTTAVSSALGMGAAFTFVLVCSNILISLLRNVIPAKRPSALLHRHHCRLRFFTDCP